MKAKEYLQRIKTLDAVIYFRTERLENQIAEKIEQIDKWNSIAMKTTSSMQSVKIGDIVQGIERVQSSGNKDSRADAICEKLDLQDIYINEFMPIIQNGFEKIKAIEKERNEIIETLELLPPDEFELLYIMYAGKKNKKTVGNKTVIFHEYLTLAEAAYELGKSRRTVDTLHGSGLAKVQKVIDERK